VGGLDQDLASRPYLRQRGEGGADLIQPEGRCLCAVGGDHRPSGELLREVAAEEDLADQQVPAYRQRRRGDPAGRGVDAGTRTPMAPLIRYRRQVFIASMQAS
jgi:hypothetical protein